MAHWVKEEVGSAVSQSVPASPAASVSSRKGTDINLDEFVTSDNHTVAELRTGVAKLHLHLYHPGRNKVSDSWDISSKPTDWPDHVPFENPHSGSKDENGKRNKPKKPILDKMYKFLREKYLAHKDSEAETHLIKDTEHLRTALACRLETTNTLLQKPYSVNPSQIESLKKELYRVYNRLRVKPEEELTNAYMEFSDVCASIETLFDSIDMLPAECTGSYFMQEVERIMIALRQMGQPTYASTQEINRCQHSSDTVPSSSTQVYNEPCDNNYDYMTSPQMVHPDKTTEQEGQVVQIPTKVDCNAMDTEETPLEEIHNRSGQGPNTTLTGSSQLVPDDSNTASEDLACCAEVFDAVMAEDFEYDYLTSQHELFDNELNIVWRSIEAEDEDTTSKTTEQKGQVVQLPPKGDCNAMDTDETPLLQVDSGFLEELEQSNHLSTNVSKGNIPLLVDAYNAAGPGDASGTVASLAAPSSSGIGSLSSQNGHFTSQNGQFPSQNGQFPSLNAPSSSGIGSLSSQNGHFTSQNGQFPSQNGQFPSLNAPSSSGIGSLSSQNGHFTSQNGQFPSQNGQFLSHNAPSSSGIGSLSTQNGHFPSQNTALFSSGFDLDWNYSFPSQDSPVSVGIGQCPSQNAPSSSGISSLSAGNSHIPNQNALSSWMFDPVSAGNVFSPSQNDPSSSAFLVGNGQNDPVFSGNDPIPNQNDPMPSVPDPDWDMT